MADAVGRAEDAPLVLEDARGLELDASKRLLVFAQLAPDGLVGHANLFTSFDRPPRVEQVDVCSFDSPEMSVGIARMVESGGAKTDY